MHCKTDTSPAGLAGLGALALATLLAAGAQGQQTTLLWGDTHLHTSYSTDAYSNGNTMADPDTAFRFAKGLPVIHPGTGERIQLERPLDFLVVADHAEMLQLQYRLSQKDPAWMAKSSAARLSENLRAAFGEIVRIGYGGGEEVLENYHTPELRGRAWATQVDITEKHNEPGKFTALIGWEWSSAPDYANLHRVVFTASNAEVAKGFIPLSYYDTQRPEELWDWLEKTSVATGADFIAIPHNSNMSDGKMFDMVDSAGRPLTAQYTRTRMRWEPVMEVTQTKGTSETMTELSPDDPFAGFEVRNKLLINTPSAISPNSYARGALRQGLQLEASTGTNPYKFGMIGSTDSHTGLSSQQENNFYGKMVNDTLPAQRAEMRGNFPAWEISASGLAAVWATANTREDIAAAFKRKEVYATTGTRMSVRFFAGFAFTARDASTNDLAAVGYRKGIPMGGDLTAAPKGKAPGFLVQVSKDPLGANLDRIQIVKGWMDAQGNTHEKVFDVAWSGKRKPDANGMVPALASTVDIDSASYKNTIGDAQLSAVWTDPQFDAAQSAFYYVRALEIPTPRHQVYDAVALKMDPRETGLPLEIQERAYSSPIWYTP